MAKSELINELAVAMAKAQGAIAHASKDSENPFHKSKYADLANVWEACRKQLSENGLSVVQLPDGLEDNCLILDTTLMHSSGQWISSRIKMPMAKQDPQGYGSTLTYARRYALAAIVGVYQDDDDAEAGKKQPQEQPTKVTEAQVKSLYIKCTKDGLSHDDVHGLIKWKFKVESAKDLLIPDFAYLMNNISKTWTDYIAEQSKTEVTA